MNSLTTLAGSMWRHFMHDSLRRNSSLLILSQAINAGATFIFWVICAHLFKTSEVGLATSLISFGILVSTFTNLGLPNTVLRFLPTSKKQGGLFIAALCLVAGFSLLGGLVGLALIKILVPKLGFIRSSLLLSIILVLLVMCNALSALTDGILMAFRRGQYILAKALAINVPRTILPFFIVSLGVAGITGTYVIVLAAGISLGIFLAIRRLLINQEFKPTLAEVGQHRGFAAGNYFGGMFGILPSTLVPLIVLTRLGAIDAAYFYMPLQIAAFLSIIPSSTSQAMISESSQQEDAVAHKQHFKNAFVHAYQLLIPAVILLTVVGWLILRIYGQAYAAHGYVPLLILSLASLFVGINWLGDTWLNVQKRTRAYFLMNAFNALIVVFFVYLFSTHGLIGVGIGWLIAQVITAVVYISIFARSQLFSFAGRFRTSP
jgi:O-antigen/teichoic acid export membrane protein